MRVLFICDFAAFFPGSFIESLYSLAEFITGEGGKVWFIFPEERYYLEPLKKQGKVSIIPSFRGRKFDLNLYKAARTIVKSENIQVIHTHFGLAGFLAASLLSSHFNCSHLAHERNTSRFYNKKINFFKRIGVISFFGLIDLVSTTRYIAISSEVKSSLIRYNGLKPDKIKIVPNAILSKRSGITSEFPAWLTEKLKNRKIIGMVAHMGPQKDHFSVIEAAKFVIQDIPSALFVLIGGNLVNDPADTRASYEKIVNDLKLNDNVLFAGETSDPYPYIEMFDIGILISHWEGFGNALVEYMLRKKPVIGTAVGGIKDIIIDGENGFLVPPEKPDILAEKIIWLLNNPLEAGHMGERGFIRAQKEYSMEVWIKRIGEVYRSAL